MVVDLRAGSLVQMKISRISSRFDFALDVFRSEVNSGRVSSGKKSWISS